MEIQQPGLNEQILVELANTKMPFGRYAGRCLIDLPEPYVLWFQKKGFPAGHLGVLMENLVEIKANGLESLIRPLKNQQDMKRY